MFLIKTKAGIIQLQNATRIDCFVQETMTGEYLVYLDVDHVRVRLMSFESCEDSHAFIEEIEKSLVAGLATDSAKVHQLSLIVSNAMDATATREMSDV